MKVKLKGVLGEGKNDSVSYDGMWVENRMDIILAIFEDKNVD